MPVPAAPEPFRFRHEGPLGTRIEVRVVTAVAAEAEAVERAVMDEIARLERVCSVFDPDSELRRWMMGATEPGPDLTELLALAVAWYERTGGAFHPAMGGIARMWAEASVTGIEPDLQALAAAAPLPFTVTDDGGIVVTGSLDGVDLNAIAKGWIVDRGFVAGLHAGTPRALTVNAGGDLLHRGIDSLVVGIEDPRRPVDNAPPWQRVRLTDGAVATSGGSRRGWQVGDRSYGHVLDPRNGRPADGILGATVIAPSAATADVLATALLVTTPGEGLAMVAAVPGASCCLITADGAVVADPHWEGYAIRPG